MMRKKTVVKLAFFDVDKTIVKYDSMFLFLAFSLKRKPYTIYYLPFIFIGVVLLKLKVMSIEKVKALFFYAIGSFRERDLKFFFDKYLMKNLYKDAVAEMIRKKELGYRIVLISASPYAYLKFFEEFPYVDAIMGTNLEYREGRYLNKIEGTNCKGEEKVVRITQYLDSMDMEIDYESSCAYSDSLSDLPMFNLVKHRYLINGSSKRNDQANLEVLVWK